MRSEIVDFCVAFVESLVKYRVHRGPVNWAEYQFDQFPRAFAVMVDDSTFLAPKDGFDEMNLSFEVAARMPASPPSSNDTLFEEIKQDIQSLVIRMADAKAASGDNLVVRIDPSARLVEFHDVRLQVMGVAVTLNLTY